MAKKTIKKTNKPQFQKFAPVEQLVEHEFKPGHIPSKQEIEDKKILQGALLQATQEFMRIHHEAIKARAFEILKEKGL